MYDIIIIGAGAAGLFAGASFHSRVNGLILNKGKISGQKILMSGGGKCNITHAGDIKDFTSCYGKNGSRIRTVLYRFSNKALQSFFEERGISVTEAEDGRVFPEAMNAEQIKDCIEQACLRNGFEIKNNTAVTSVLPGPDFESYSVCCGTASYKARRLIIATGGSSYPATGSDGDFFDVLKSLNLSIEGLRPALTPVYVEDYPYEELSGISFKNAVVSVSCKSGQISMKGDVLLAHQCFSGPAVLDVSEYVQRGCEIRINYIPQKSAEALVRELSLCVQGRANAFVSVLYSLLNADSLSNSILMPKRFLEKICLRCGLEPAQKASHVSGACIKNVVRLLTGDSYIVKKCGGMNVAMVTAGGVCLDEINMKTMEAKKYPGMYFAGEVLDVAGKTGGYNLQFAFSSGHLAAMDIEKTLHSSSD